MVTQSRRAAGFWLAALTAVVFLAASSAPSPLYVVYQQEWHFGPAVLTVVFATYAAVLLLTLLVVGGLSDFVGRRPVILAAIALEIASLAVFLVADDVADLIVGRGLQGLATGIGLGALGAAIGDLAPPGRPTLAAGINVASPTLGLAAGALLSGVLVQFAPMPTTLVFDVLTLLLVVLLIACAVVLPARDERRAGALASLRPTASVPPAARRAFRNAVPVLVATWSIGGLVLSLGASLAVGVFGVDNHVIGGIVVTAMAGSGSLAAFAVRGRPARSTMLASCLVLATGMAVVLVAVATTSLPVFFAGLVVTGLGFGAGFVGALGSVARLVRPHERAELLSAVYVPSYLAFGGAAVLAGLAVPHFGLRPTTTVFGLVVIALALVAVGAELAARRQEDREKALTGALFTAETPFPAAKAGETTRSMG
ncbi:MFS transporter [Kineosporia sp. J2-2]|uniref:MFS transporter n=1 Tax=Kineosporia corallincola TaxID=2835133 RepID=A0ABS5TMM3_9ACTN|nr:MFS transporter [Kineosporia corallincola]MBT0772342.1 MFS transporter [Kineosporia corallincola]